MREFKGGDLSNFNGRDGEQAYMAFKGKVYDVSSIFQDSEHGGVKAGTDITETFGNGLCPHQEDIFRQFKEIGIIR